MSNFLAGLFMYLNISFLVVALECLALILLFAFLINFFLLVKHKKRSKKIEKRLSIVEQLIDNIQPEKGLEAGFDGLFELLISLVKGQSYYLYLPSSNNEYILKSFRGTVSEQDPDYQSYEPPVNILSSTSHCTLIKDGEVSLFEIPIKGGQGIIRIGPAVQNEKIDFAAIDFLAEKLHPVFKIMIQMMERENKDHVVENSNTAIQEVADYQAFYAEEEFFGPQPLSCLEALKVLAGAIDDSAPFMVGYSDLMSRYAGIIAKEMKLGAEEVKDIVLAAFLSNIGMIGMPGDLLLLKEEKYSSEEYEMMKLHCDLGASIVEITLKDSKVAAYIRHHHERIDGSGYPSGLKGFEIPLGARIIAVTQFFIAKITGRKYRDPLSFEQAVTLLQEAAGSQLDEEIVNVLVNWFKKKQSHPLRRNRSLGPCWEMRCSPESICRECFAFKKTAKNCWDYEAVNCAIHGNTCTSCYVYTEYIYRTQILTPWEEAN